MPHKTSMRKHWLQYLLIPVGLASIFVNSTCGETTSPSQVKTRHAGTNTASTTK